MSIQSKDNDRDGAFPSVADKVRFLSSPRHYPGRPAEVRVIETHMSYVFLTPTTVYKQKKPVQSDYFDFSNLASRRWYCEAEVRLNRRLAPTTYLGLVSLQRTQAGHLQLAGAGQVTEWLVHMRRLPSEKMLDQLIKKRRLTGNHIEQLGRLLVNFYRRADRIEVSPDEYRERFRVDLDHWISSLRNPLYQLPAERLDRISRQLLGFLAHEDGHGLEERSERVVEAHGDLKPEHICFTDPPEIFDCLEFSRELRSLDPVEELAFLAIECERLNNREAGDQLIRLYSRLTRDQPANHIVGFYKSCRSLLRAHLSARHLLDDQVKDPAHWLEQTRDYLNLTEHYLEKLNL